MKIRLVNCNLLIAFHKNISVAVIAAYLFSARHESIVRRSLETSLMKFVQLKVYDVLGKELQHL